jgi:CheY-like chemotaxis protein
MRQGSEEFSAGLSSEDEDSVEKLPEFSILLVDDDLEIRSLTRTFLEHEGYRVYSSGDAMRAAQVFRSAEKVDLLIADIYLPGRSGLELAVELKQIRRDLPVLLISGGLMDTAQLEQLELEGWSFLAKPFALPELLGAVHRILNTENVSNSG